MITAVALLLDRCGLSIREAADFLKVREDTIKSWRTGRNPTPLRVINELKNLYEIIDDAADQTIAMIDQASSMIKSKSTNFDVEIGIANDDHEAKTLGLPSVGAHAALLGLVVARCTRSINIVPRGSTSASAAASDAHGF